MANKTQIQTELDAILAALHGADSGLLSDEIAAAAGLKLTKRTLQRRLGKLIDDGLVNASGATRARSYSLSQQAEANTTTTGNRNPDVPHQHELFVPVSKKGSAIQAYIARTVASRNAMGYDRAFLENYIPGKTYYLSASERKKLHELGRTQGTMQAAGTYALQIVNRLLIDLSWNSSRLEGNTYSLLETQRLLNLGQSITEKEPRDAQMILNHKGAIEFLVSNANDIAFDRLTILNLHALLSENLLDDPGASGRLRRDAVGIGESAYMPPELPQVIEECFDLMLAKASAIEDPFEQAFFIMVQLPYLQPFIDVNKRVSRLALNIPLIKHNLAPLSFIAVPDQTYLHGLLGVYERQGLDLIKDVFLWAYEKSSARYVAIRQTLGEPDPFRMRYRSELKTVVADVIRQPMDQLSASQHIKAWTAKNIDPSDALVFIETAETELLSLHEGNFARYQIKPNEFTAWRKVWNG